MESHLKSEVEQYNRSTNKYIELCQKLKKPKILTTRKRKKGTHKIRDDYQSIDIRKNTTQTSFNQTMNNTIQNLESPIGLRNNQGLLKSRNINNNSMEGIGAENSFMNSFKEHDNKLQNESNISKTSLLNTPLKSSSSVVISNKYLRNIKPLPQIEEHQRQKIAVDQKLLDYKEIMKKYATMIKSPSSTKYKIRSRNKFEFSTQKLDFDNPLKNNSLSITKQDGLKSFDDITKKGIYIYIYILGNGKVMTGITNKQEKISSLKEDDLSKLMGKYMELRPAAESNKEQTTSQTHLSVQFNPPNDIRTSVYGNYVLDSSHSRVIKSQRKFTARAGTKNSQVLGNIRKSHTKEETESINTMNTSEQYTKIPQERILKRLHDPQSVSTPTANILSSISYIYIYIYRTNSI